MSVFTLMTLVETTDSEHQSYPFSNLAVGYPTFHTAHKRLTAEDSSRYTISKATDQIIGKANLLGQVQTYSV